MHLLTTALCVTQIEDLQLFRTGMANEMMLSQVGFFQYGAEMSKDVEPQVELSESQYELDINPQYIPGTCLSFFLSPKQGLFQSTQGAPFGFQVTNG